MVKTVELTGTEMKVEGLGGKNAAIYNKSDGAVYASCSANVEPNADGVIEIPAGGYRGLNDTQSTVYLLGSGNVELTGTDYPVNFKMPSQPESGGGGGTGDVTKAYVDAQDTTNLGAAKAYTDTELSTVNEDISGKMNKNNPTGTGAFSMNREAESDIGDYSFAEGYGITASGNRSHAEGSLTTAGGNDSHAEGYSTVTVYGKLGGHAEGGYCIAVGARGHAQGYTTKSEHDDSFAAGVKTLTGHVCDTVLGRLNIAKSDSLLTIGWGSGTTRSAADKPDDMDFNTYQRSGDDVVLKNVFRVNTAGAVYGVGAFNTSGADYAEYIKPWFDNNAENEDRRGYFVTIKDGKLRFAEPNDYIVGITSGNPSVVGNSDEDWLGRWQRDEFNELVYQDVEVDDYEEREDENGNIVSVKIGSHIEKQTVQNPNYDLSQKYIERKDRPEWSYVGMIGVLPLRDDGTCVAGGFAKCGSGGVATAANEWECHKMFFVIERINDHIISVEMR